MKFLIHFEVNGVEDAVVVEGSTTEEIREKADAELLKRGAINPWSEEIK